MENQRGFAMKGAIILSPAAIRWAESNGHADDVVATRRVLADWKAHQEANASYYSRLSADQLEKAVTATEKRLARLREAAKLKEGVST